VGADHLTSANPNSILNNGGGETGHNATRRDASSSTTCACQAR